MPTKDLVFRFLGVDAGAGREFDRMAGKASATSGALMKLSLGVAATGTAFAVESVRMAAKFQQSMELIHTQAGASQAEVNKLSKAVLALAGPTATAPDTLTEGLYHLESAGFRGAKAMQALRIAAEGAKVGGANLEDVTNALNATLVSGIAGAQNMTAAMGALNATVGAGDMRMQDLAEALGTGVLAAVKGFGLSLNDVGAALATFGDNNIRGADAATQLRMAVLFMAKPAKTASGTLHDLGMTSKTLATDLREHGLGGALTDLHNRLIKAGDTGAKMGQVLLDLFGHKAGTGISILEQQFSRFQLKQEEVQKGSKNFASDWTAYTKTFGYSWDRARAAFESMTIQIGTKLLPTATKAMNWIGTTGVKDLDKFGGWVSRNKRPIEDIAKALAAVAAFKFTTGKLNDLSRLLGFGGKGGAGLLGGAAAMEKPIPVYVTNMKGGAGFSGGGKTAAKDVEHAAEGGAATGTAAKVVEKLGLTGIKRLGGPLTLAYLATQGGDVGRGTGNLYAAGMFGGPQSAAGKASMQVAAILKSLLGSDAGHYIKQDGAISTLQTGPAVSQVLSGGTTAQVKALKQLAKEYPAVRNAVADYEKSIRNLNQLLVINGGLAKNNATEQKRLSAMTAAAHHRAVDDIIAQLRRIPGAMSQLAAEARAAGNTIGQQLDAGITVGITSGSGNVKIVTKQLVDGVIHTATAHAQLGSPSKRTMYIGKMLGEGIAVGIKGSVSSVATAAQNLVDKVNSKLDGLRSARSGLAGDIYGNLLGGASLSNVTAFSNTGGGTVGTITSYLTTYKAREKAFVRNLGIARKKGLSLAEVTDIAKMGLDQGGPLAAALAGATRSQLHGINTLESQIASTARAFGNTVAGANYDTQIAKLARLQHETNSALAIIKELLKRKTKLDPETIKELARTLAKLHITLNLKELDQKTGRQIAVG